MNKKNNQRTRITKMLIKKSYTDMMKVKPAAKITVKEICELSQINRSTFYIHFDEPNDVLKEIEDEIITQTEEYLKTLGSFEEGNTDAESFMLSFLKYLRKNEEIFKTLLIDNSDPHFYNKFYGVALKIIQESFTIELEDRYKYYTYRFIISGSIDILKTWIASGMEMSEQTVGNILFHLCEGAIRGAYSLR